MPLNTPNRGYTYPTYTDPAAFPTQEQLFATQVDADVEALENAIIAGKNQPTARLFNSVAQSIPNATNTNATWDTEQYDNAGFFPGSGATITIPSPGAYLISYRGTFATNDTGYRQARGIVGGTTTIMGRSSNAGSTGPVAITFVGIYGFFAGNTFTVSLQQSSGGALNITSSTLSIVKVAT
jgi:hypothetical protein